MPQPRSLHKAEDTGSFPGLPAPTPTAGLASNPRDFIFPEVLGVLRLPGLGPVETVRSLLPNQVPRPCGQPLPSPGSDTAQRGSPIVPRVEEIQQTLRPGRRWAERGTVLHSPRHTHTHRVSRCLGRDRELQLGREGLPWGQLLGDSAFCPLSAQPWATSTAVPHAALGAGEEFLLKSNVLRLLTKALPLRARHKPRMSLLGHSHGCYPCPP